MERGERDAWYAKVGGVGAGWLTRGRVDGTQSLYFVRGSGARHGTAIAEADASAPVGRGYGWRRERPVGGPGNFVEIWGW